MARRLIVQGDDRYALYSTITCDIIVHDASLEELVDIYREDEADKAEAEVRLWCAGTRQLRDHFTVDEAVGWISGYHGKNAAKKARALLEAPPIPETPFEAAVRKFPVGCQVKVSAQSSSRRWNVPGIKVVCGHERYRNSDDDPIICVCLISTVQAQAGWFHPDDLALAQEEKKS